MKVNCELKKSSGFTTWNITGISKDGRPVSTQVHSKSGCPLPALQTALRWLDEGEADKKNGGLWNSEIEHVFVHDTTDKVTYRFDMQNEMIVSCMRQQVAMLKPATATVNA